jgi:hypothetical protein
MWLWRVLMTFGALAIQTLSDKCDVTRVMFVMCVQKVLQRPCISAIGVLWYVEYPGISA